MNIALVCQRVRDFTKIFGIVERSFKETPSFERVTTGQRTPSESQICTDILADCQALSTLPGLELPGCKQ